MERTALWTAALVGFVFCGAFGGVATADTTEQPAAADASDQPGAVPTGHDQTGESPVIVATTAYELAPTQPGRVDVTWRFEIPSAVGSVTVSAPGNGENLQTAGFVRTDAGRLRWDEDDQSTRTPRVRFTASVNRTRDAAGPIDAGGRFTFLDRGDWALFGRQVPQNIEYSYRGDSTEPTVERRSETAGPGVVGSAMVFLGPHDSVERTARGQTFQLVVPEAATLTEEPRDIFASVAAASGRLRVGDRDERVLMIAAPQEAPWAVRGLQIGDSDFYVIADESVDTADNVWLHEYVHTRQNFETTDSSEWLTEASAEYYAGLLTLEQGRIDFTAFRRYLERADSSRFDGVRLVDPATWRPNGGNYVTGALVAGALDRRLRETTDSAASLQAVLGSLNRRQQATHADFLGAVERAGGPSVRDFARQHTETTARPSVWSARIHERYFGTVPASFSFRFPPVGSESLTVSGAFGGRRYSGDPLVRGESLTLPVNVTNIGGAAGTYELVVTRDGEPVATRSGRLGAGAGTTEGVTVALDATGRYRLSTGDDSLAVRVLDPAPLRVTDLSSRRTDDGVRVTATVENRFRRPGEGTVSLRLDGAEVASERFALGPGETATLAATRSLTDPGTYEFTAGNATLRLTVDDREGSVGTPGVNAPGFGPAVAILAALAGLLLAHRVQ
jgi:hypothetical protein